MTARDPDRELDDLLGEGGGKLGNLYRRLPRYEPPRRLDRAVLGEAARAVHSGKPPRRQRWIVGLGSAAGLVLAAGIAWRIGHDATSERGAPPAVAPTVVPVQPIDESARAKRAQPEAEAADTLSAPAAQNAAAPKSAEREPPKLRQSMNRAAKPAPIPPPAAAPPPEPFPAEQRREAMEKDAQKSEAVGTASHDAAAAASAGAGIAAPALEKRAAASERARMPGSPTVPSGSVELRRDMQLPPAEWLSHVRELEREGRHQQAIESLRLFVRAHPDRKIPADLRPLLD